MRVARSLHFTGRFRVLNRLEQCFSIFISNQFMWFLDVSCFIRAATDSGAFEHDVGVLDGVTGADQTNGVRNPLIEFNVRLMLHFDALQ